MGRADKGYHFNLLRRHNIFPRGYTLTQPTAEYVAHELVASLFREDTFGFLEAPSYSRKIAEQIATSRTGDHPYITLTVREIERDNANNTRTIDYDVWLRCHHKIKGERCIETIVVRDTEPSFFACLVPSHAGGARGVYSFTYAVSAL